MKNVGKEEKRLNKEFNGKSGFEHGFRAQQEEMSVVFLKSI